MEPDALLSKFRVVVAEDEKFSRSVVMGQLRDLGCAEIEPATDGQHGLDLLRKRSSKPTLLIADFNMPGVNGLQVLKLIRTAKAMVPHDLPVMMMTGMSDFGLVKTAMALDVDAFVVKPATKAILTTRFKKILGEPRDLKTPAHYATINVDEISERLLKSDTEEPPPAEEEKKESIVSGVRMKLSDVPEGSVLVEDIKAPGGELLLAAGVTLSARFLRRLSELSSALKLEYLTVLPQAPAES